jgi:hypothetical protein
LHKQLWPASIDLAIAVALQIVSDFAMQLYTQAKHLQTLTGHNPRPAQ